MTLEQLVVGNVYKAEPKEVITRRGMPAVSVEIIAGEGYASDSYHGIIIPLEEIPQEDTRYLEQTISNAILNRLIISGAYSESPINVRVIGLPRDLRNGNYIVMATDKEPNLENALFDSHMAIEEADFFGPDILTVKVMFIGRNFDPGVDAYLTNGTKISGFVKPTPIAKDNKINSELYRRKKAENKITRDIISGNSDSGQAPLQVGDILIVRRLISKFEKSRVRYLEPVVNFMPEDNASYQGGSVIVTYVADQNNEKTVTSIDAGYHIYNLPITGVIERPNGEIVGVGHIPRPKENYNNNPHKQFFYKPVYVHGGDLYKGKIIGMLDVGLNAGVVWATIANS